MYKISDRATGRFCIVQAKSMQDACQTYGIEPDNDYPNHKSLLKGKIKSCPELLVSVEHVLFINTRAGLESFFSL
mgnify:CR=1 FL=1